MKPGLSSRPKARDCPVTFARAVYHESVRADRSDSILERAIVGCAVIAILLGAFFRVYALDAPLFWQDEVATALRVTGHDAAGYAHVFDGKIHSLAEIRSFVELDPAKTPLDVAATILREDPQHVPIYYMLERGVIGVVGTSASAFRVLSVACGLLAIGLAFVLGRQIAGKRVGFVAASLVALSPIFILMSRQAREYALFADVALLATIAFVYALRRENLAAWIVYALCVVAGVYSDSLFPLIVIGHGVAAIAVNGLRSRAFVAWLGASLAGALTLVPWIVAAQRAGSRVAGSEEWIHRTYPFTILIEKTAFNLGTLAFDGEYASLRLIVVALVGIALLGAFTIAGVRASRGLARSLPLAIALPTPIVLAAADVATHSHFATVPRYLVASWVGLDLAVAVGIGVALTTPRLRRYAFASWIAILLLGVAAATLRGGAENWWDNSDGIAYQALARVIDAHDRPLVASENRWNTPLELGRYVRDDTRMLLFEPPAVPPIGSSGPAFVVAPSRGVVAALARGGAFRVTNVSPTAATPNRSLSTATHRPQSDPGDPTAPGNALWLLQPR